MVTSTDLDRLARTAYEAHRSAHPESLPPWEDATEQEQKAWKAAVSAVTSMGDATLADAGPAPSIALQVGERDPRLPYRIHRGPAGHTDRQR